MSDSGNESYAKDEEIQEEIKQARRLFARNGWPVIDVTRRSVEETAASIIHLHNGWLAKQEELIK